MDGVVKSLLLRLAEDLDPDALGPLADRLEEMGDARAVGVRDMHDTARRHPGLAGTACREALADFPEGPRWRVQCLGAELPPGRAGDYVTPHAARQEYGWLFTRLPAFGWRVAGPHWPTPPAAAEPHSCAGG